MAKKKTDEKINLDSILFKCRDILRKARNSGSFFEKRDMMLTLVFLRFIGEKYEDGIERLRQTLIKQGLDPEDENIRAAFFDDATFTDGTYNLPLEARWSTIINTPAPGLNVALDTALHSIATASKDLKGCFIEGTFTTRNLGANDIKKLVDEVNKMKNIIATPKFTLKFRKMKTRWGVCNYKLCTITLNTELIRYSRDEIRYVIVHEMCHFYHHDHSKKFWNIIIDC